MNNIIDFHNKNDSRNNFKTNELYLLVGIPCSGKSTYANKCHRNSNTIIISSDDIRKELTGSYEFSKQTNNLIFDIAKERTRVALSNGFNVVFDATNIIKKYRNDFVKISKNCGCKINAIVFDTLLSECLKRNIKRNSERKISEDILVMMYKNRDSVGIKEGFSEIYII